MKERVTDRAIIIGCNLIIIRERQCPLYTTVYYLQNVKAEMLGSRRCKDRRRNPEPGNDKTFYYRAVATMAVALLIICDF